MAATLLHSSTGVRALAFARIATSDGSYMLFMQFYSMLFPVCVPFILEVETAYYPPVV